MTSFWLIDETSRTRSTASNVAARSAPPWVIARSPISFSTSFRLGDGIADHDPRRLAHQDHADRVAPSRFLDQLGRHGLGLVEPARPAGGVTHAQRGVHDQDPMDATPGDHHAERLEERLGHRRDDQQDDQRPDRQQEPLLDPDPPLILPDRRQQEPHGRPRHLAELAPVQQVDDDRHRRRRQPVEQGGIGESQGPEQREGHSQLQLGAGGRWLVSTRTISLNRCCMEDSKRRNEKPEHASPT